MRMCNNMSVSITFIGTGDAFNSGGRAHQSILLCSDNFKMLIDCGSNTLLRLQQMNINPNDIDAVLFTHFHADHFLGTAHFDLSFSNESSLPNLFLLSVCNGNLAFINPAINPSSSIKIGRF